VVAHPWAEVHVDGKLVDTTPFDQPVALPAGEHQVVARHPRLGELRQRLRLAPAQVASWIVDLEAKREQLTVAPAAGSAPAGGAP
jgi:hypothetical protein